MKDFKLGVWSHRITDFGERDELKERVAGLADVGFDLVVPCVKNAPGAVDFLSDVADVNPEYADWDPLEVLIEECGERGIKVHPWFCVFREGDQSHLLREHPESAAVFEEGAQGGWACACRPGVQDYVFALYKEIAERYGPAGLHLDYIRTGSLCRCDYCRAETEKLGVNVDDAPRGSLGYAAWSEWRAGRVTAFVRRMRELTSSEGIELSAAVFPDVPVCIIHQGQDWPLWAEEKLVDFLFPMNYTPSTRAAATRTQCHLALAAGHVPIWEGLCRRSSQAMLDAPALERQMRAVLETGAEGICLFSYPALDDEDMALIRGLKQG